LVEVFRIVEEGLWWCLGRNAPPKGGAAGSPEVCW
jgi:hypothetical protein